MQADSSAPTVQDSHFWEERYQTGSSRWDLGQPAPAFLQLLESPEAPAPGRLLVLGCGRGHDALAFAERGFQVVGVDFAPSAIAAAQEAAQARGLTVEFRQQDIFSLPEAFTGAFDYVAEHTCLCALDPSQRPAYVDLVRSLLKPGGELLAVFFTHGRPGGPPFDITRAEICDRFAPAFEIVRLEPVIGSVAERAGEEHWGRLRRR